MRLATEFVRLPFKYDVQRLLQEVLASFDEIFGRSRPNACIQNVSLEDQYQLN